MAIPTSITDLDTSEALNSPAGSDNVGGTLDNFLRSHAAIIRRQFSKGADVNSASTTTIPPDCSYANVVKVVSTINAFTDNFNGRIVYLKFEAGITLKHSSSLIMPAGADVVTVAGDVAAFINETSGAWRCLSYPRYTDADHPGAEPAITWPLMTWADTGNMLLKRRNEANTAWVTLGPLLDFYFARGNILGALSVSSGIPTGAAMQLLGSTNGFVARLASGLQICTRGDITLTQENTQRLAYTWTYPAQFSSSPVVFLINNAGADTVLQKTTAGSSPTNASAVVRLFATGSDSISGGTTRTGCGLIAVGRWFE
ncbi:MAG: hypothetical protein WBF88_17465 [Pusillimonas sp.]